MKNKLIRIPLYHLKPNKRKKVVKKLIERESKRLLNERRI